MKVLTLLIIASILTYATARVVGPQLVDSRKNSKLQSKQEDDEGVIVDPVITASDIQVYEVTSAASVEESSVEVSSSTSSEATSAETESSVVNEDDANPINRYCTCTTYECNCCRDFSLPLVPIRGPGCANIRYLEGDRMSVGIKFGNRVLANRVISGRKDTPVCLPLPGGFTNFCGRIYGISKKNEDFKACLGLELRADQEVEAALRVSCFSFGPKGLKVTEAEPIPVAAVEEDEDDDDDIFGLGSDDDEDDDILDDDDDTPTGQSAGNVSNASDDDDDDTDYTGLSLLSGDLFDDLLGDDEDQSAAPSRKTPKRKTKGTVKQPEDLISSAAETQNEVDGTFSSAEQSKPSDDDDDESEEESGGILDILDDLISDDDDEDEEDEEEKVEDEVSEEIAENELEDDAEEIVEETDETSPELEKDNESEAENDREEQEFAEAVADDDDDIEDDDDEEEEELPGKPTNYIGLSLLGLRSFFSRYFQ